MSWSIANVVNEVKISKKCARDLFEVQEATSDELWYSPDGVTNNGKLTFDPDHMEHMDYLYNEDIQKVLLKYKVKGDICFGSLDGDNAGSFWGYRFDGKGGMSTLEGKLEWYVRGSTKNEE